MIKLYSARDSVSGVWQEPVPYFNDQVAKRSFCYALVASAIPDHFAKDVDLYCIGSFDETTGEVFSCQPVHITNGRCDLYDAYLKVKNGTYTSEDYNNEIFTKA